MNIGESVVSYLMLLDEKLFIVLNQTFTSSLMDMAMALFVQAGTIRAILPLGLLGLFMLDRKNFSRNAVLLSAIFFAEIFVGSLIKDIVGRSRPFAHDGIITSGHAKIHMLYLVSGFPFVGTIPPGVPIQAQFGLGPSSGGSFPSGHVMVAFGAASFFSDLFVKYRVAFFTTAAICGFSRIYIGVHYPSDVIAGMLLGIAIALYVLRLGKA
jgi:membrane-associated phospholipid phosphatase